MPEPTPEREARARQAWEWWTWRRLTILTLAAGLLGAAFGYATHGTGAAITIGLAILVGLTPWMVFVKRNPTAVLRRQRPPWLRWLHVIASGFVVVSIAAGVIGRSLRPVVGAVPLLLMVVVNFALERRHRSSRH